MLGGFGIRFTVQVRACGQQSESNPLHGSTDERQTSRLHGAGERQAARCNCPRTAPRVPRSCLPRTEHTALTRAHCHCRRARLPPHGAHCHCRRGAKFNLFAGSIIGLAGEAQQAVLETMQVREGRALVPSRRRCRHLLRGRAPTLVPSHPRTRRHRTRAPWAASLSRSAARASTPVGGGFV